MSKSCQRSGGRGNFGDRERSELGVYRRPSVGARRCLWNFTFLPPSDVHSRMGLAPQKLHVRRMGDTADGAAQVGRVVRVQISGDRISQ